ncbi:MAG: GGDEF domain-containing protein [Anaerofustis sp.]
MKRIREYGRKIFTDRIPRQYSPVYERRRVAENAPIFFVCSAVLMISESCLYFLQQKYYHAGWLMQVFMLMNVIFLPQFYYILKRKQTVPIRSSLIWQAAYELFLMLFAASLILFAQQYYDFVHVFIMVVAFSVLFANQPVWVHSLLTATSYAYFILLLPYFQPDASVRTAISLNALLSCLMALVLCRILANMKETSFLREIELEQKNEELLALTETDGMTGLLNHTSVLGRLEGEILRVREEDLPLSVILVDVDYFKDINDRFGHQVGDQVLCNVAIILLSCLKEREFAGRYGGEEFLMVLPGADCSMAIETAELVRRRIASENLVEGGLTVSGGVCEYEGETLSGLISIADKRLYHAKETGRNCFVAKL